MQAINDFILAAAGQPVGEAVATGGEPGRGGRHQLGADGSDARDRVRDVLGVEALHVREPLLEPLEHLGALEQASTRAPGGSTAANRLTAVATGTGIPCVPAR